MEQREENRRKGSGEVYERNSVSLGLETVQSSRKARIDFSKGFLPLELLVMQKSVQKSCVRAAACLDI